MFHSEYHEHHKTTFRWILIIGSAVVALGLFVVVFTVDRAPVVTEEMTIDDENQITPPITREQQQRAIDNLNRISSSDEEDSVVSEEENTVYVNRLQNISNADIIDDEDDF